MIELSVILPAYRECENLRTLLPKIKETLIYMGITWEILVIDTMIPMDQTAEVCQDNSARYIPRSNGNNYGDAIRSGIRLAAGERILLMDADGSHDPHYIVAMYHEALNGNDLVIGSRYTQGGGTHNGLVLRFMSHMVNRVYRILFHISIKDVSNSFRIYNATMLKSIFLFCDNFDIVEEILIRLRQQYPKLKMKEVPIFFDRRQHGESKRDLVSFIFSYISSIRRLQKASRETSPWPSIVRKTQNEEREDIS